MKLIKRLVFAFKSVFTSSFVGLLSVLVSIFYFFVAMDMFWNGNVGWTTPGRTILFHTPLFIEVAAIVVVFVHGFMKKKLEQQANALSAQKPVKETNAQSGDEPMGESPIETSHEE